MTEVNVAILGAGFMGSTHARAYKKIPDVEIAAIYAHSGNRAEPLAAEVDSVWTAEIETILRDESIDAVEICLPTPEHREMVEAVLQAGKHVLIEKPLALTREDAKAIVEVAEASSQIVMIAHVLRFWPEYVAAAGSRRWRRTGTPDIRLREPAAGVSGMVPAFCAERSHRWGDRRSDGA